MAKDQASKKPAPRNTKQTPAATTKDAGVVAPVQAKPTDWERIELDYRVDINTLRQIAEEREAILARGEELERGTEKDLVRLVIARANASAEVENGRA